VEALGIAIGRVGSDHSGNRDDSFSR
jgi:hypothetical protein